MANLKTNTPRAILNGIKDESVVQLLAEPEQIPQHFPFIYIQASQGTLEPTVLGGGDLTRIYGDDIVDVRKPFFNHAVDMAATIISQGNSIITQRLVSGAYATSSMTLVATADATAAVIQDYVRDGNGNVVLDVNGDPTFEVSDVTDGVSLKFAWVDTASLANFSPTGAGDVVAYPLITATESSPGVGGDNTGVRLWKAGPTTTNPADTSVIADQEALIFNIQLVRKLRNNTAVIKEDLFGALFQEFAFKPNAFDPDTNVDLTIQHAVDNYSDDGTSTHSSPTHGPLGEITVHQGNLDTLLTQLVTVERTLTGDTTLDPYMLDWMTGKDVSDVHHYGFQIDTTGDKLTETRTHYLQGGNDGDTDLASFDAAVSNAVLADYQNPAYPLLDSARYPFSAIYDSGFSIATKKQLMKWTAYRKDVHYAYGTFVDGGDALTVSEEISVGADLRASALLYAESDLHGTAACRLVMVGHSGTKVNSNVKAPRSLVFSLAAKRARYMGAGNGFMKPGLGYDNYPLNVVDDFKNINNTWMGDVAKDAVWATGINFVQYSDRHTLFFPGFQTVYNINNSILISDIIMQIAVDVTKQAEIVWRRLSGNTTFSNLELIEESNRTLLELVNGKYDGRVRIEPNTYFTPADNARGYSWTLDVAIYGNVMRTVSQVNVITRRA